MATGSEEVVEKPAGEGETPPAKPAKPAAEATPPAGKEKPEGKEPAAAKPAAEITPAAGKKRHVLKDDDDDIPDDVELLELSKAGLKARLTRHTAKQLKDRFGTDKLDDIKERLEKLTQLEAKEEERERAAMSEKDRMSADLKKEKDRADKAEMRANAIYDQRVIEREETRVFALAEEAGMDPEYIEDQFPKFARWLNENFKPKQLKKMKDAEIKEWFVKRLEAKPKFAKEQAEAPKPKVPLTNGAGGSAPPAKGNEAGAEKTFKPGQKNSMSRQEARSEAAKLGYRY